jgi:8-amino-7-oxononanoate synthase
MSFPSLAATKASYSLLMSGATEPLIAHLRNLIEHLYSQLQTLDRRLIILYSSPLVTNASQSPCSNHQTLLRIPSEVPKSPIFSILSSEPRSLAQFCQRGGFVVRAIVAPTVPTGTERVRVCLHAGNSFEEVERLAARMGKWVESQIKPKAFVGQLAAKL